MVITDSQKTNSCVSVAKLQGQNGIVTTGEVKGGASQIVDEYMEFPSLCPIGTSTFSKKQHMKRISGVYFQESPLPKDDGNRRGHPQLSGWRVLPQDESSQLWNAHNSRSSGLSSLSQSVILTILSQSLQ